MKQIFFTPGPSQLYPTVNQHIKSALLQNIPSISHRGKMFQELFASTVENIRALLTVPDSHHIFFLSSGTEAMERVLENIVEKQSFHFVNGSFAERFYKTAEELGKSPEKIEVGFGKGFDFDTVKIPEAAEIICLTQNETSTGVSIPVNDIYKLHKRFPKKTYCFR